VPRVKNGTNTHRKHKRVLELTKGHRASRSSLYKVAHQSMLHAAKYATEHRRDRKGDFRRLWIMRINAGTRACGSSYSLFMHGLQKAQIEINRKMLAEMAVNDFEAFKQLVEQVVPAA